MAKKSKKRNKTVVGAKASKKVYPAPSKADFERDGFLQDIKHLSTPELDYRTAENLRAQVIAETAIDEHEVKLKALRMDAGRLRREQTALVTMTDARRRMTALGN